MERHKGAVLKDFKKVRPNVISAKQAGNILWIKDLNKRLASFEN
jgi:hypothetical protein